MSACHVPAMTGFEDDGKIRRQFCVSCNQDIPDKCKCIWSAIRELQESYRGLFHDYNHLEDAIVDLRKRVKDIEYRLEHIVELPRELDIRLQECERLLDKWAEKIAGKKPHKCPVCDGVCYIFLPCEETIAGFPAKKQHRCNS